MLRGLRPTLRPFPREPDARLEEFNGTSGGGEAREGRREDLAHLFMRSLSDLLVVTKTSKYKQDAAGLFQSVFVWQVHKDHSKDTNNNVTDDGK